MQYSLLFSAIEKVLRNGKCSVLYYRGMVAGRDKSRILAWRLQCRIRTGLRIG
jgi:hypothetical protein